MSRQQAAGQGIRKSSHSKAFKDGLGILTQEIDLALEWNRPSILLVVHNSIMGRIEAQEALEKEIVKKHKQVVHINIENTNPDVIRTMSETPNSGDLVFFVSGIDNADRASDGKVYRALNIRRELLVERRICVVFWLNELEAAALPRIAPDFWAFRHRVVEFAPKHGTKKQSLPVGLFIWDELIPWAEKDAQKNKFAYYEEFLIRLPKEDEAAVARIETIIKLVHYSWLLNDSIKFSGYLKDGIALLENYPIAQFQAWILNAKGIGLYEEGNKMDAGIHFKQALSHDPDNSAIMMNASIAVHGLGRNSEALLIGRRAIKNDHDNFQLWYVLSYLYLSMGKIEDAIETMKKAQKIDPHRADTYYSLAVCYYKNRQPDKCEIELSKAEKISPPQHVVQHSCIDILRGRTNEVLVLLKESLKKSEVSIHDILRDPNLPLLLDTQDFLAFE
jgi:tetratricopeptide (TPR) repeat protein